MSAGRRPINQWVGISCAGIALLIASWLILFSWLARDSCRFGIGNLWFWALLIAIGSSGGWLAYWSQNKIGEGIRQELWDEGEIVPARKMARYLNRVIGVFFLVAAIFWFVGTTMNVRAYRVGYLPSLILIQWANALIGNFREKQPGEMAPTRMFPVTTEPIRSVHWGTR